MITPSRRNFGQAVRRAKRAGTLVRYDKHYLGYSRVAQLADGTILRYRHPLALVDPCDRDDAHERAAARARSNDFAETNGKDWT